MWLLSHTVLRQTPGVSESLVQFIKLWAKQGPALFKGNLYIGGKQLRNAVSLLYGEGKLEQDTEKLLWAGAAKSKNVLLKGIAVKRSIESGEYRIDNTVYSIHKSTQEAIYDRALIIVDKIIDTYADQTAGGKKFADVPNPHDNRFNNLTGNRRGGGN